MLITTYLLTFQIHCPNTDLMQKKFTKTKKFLMTIIKKDDTYNPQEKGK